MKRDIDINEISDGKLYSANDLVKADCNDCKGCFDCCKGMGESIILDPYDVYRLTTGLGVPFEMFLADKLALNMFDGIILPHLNMSGTDEACAFLNAEGRCSIHEFRPSICRLFPLGRIYDEDGFQYFLQVNECSNKNRTKVKVKKWIDTPELKKNDKFILDWHDFVNDVQARVNSNLDEELIKKINMFILQHFFIERYNAEEFYSQFEERLKKAKAVIATLTK
ncbi:MAG: YkgJ family cysteine cluster protein [Tyzzerella sp.]|nr:YkgJ family cysteine cluster protein [Tyzzerella sp.]